MKNENYLPLIARLSLKNRYDFVRYFLVVLLFTFALLSGTAKAQDTVTGAFEGKVFNKEDNTPIPNVIVRFTNQDTNVVNSKRTDNDGKFYQGLLNPGIYIVEVTVKGFKPFRAIQRLDATRQITVQPLPIPLEPETTVPTTTPSPEPGKSPQPTTPPVSQPTKEEEKGQSVLGGGNDARRYGFFNERQAANLPLGNSTITRTFDELALLLPGVADPPQTIGNGAGPGIGPGVGSAGQFSVNGLRSRANNFTVDGSDNNDEDIGVRRQGFFTLVPQPIESIKEYQIITLLAPAQFGRNIGAQVNAVSKSGGNNIHGSIYGFFNASQLNAPNFFDTRRANSTSQLRASGNKPVLLNGGPLNVTFDSGNEDSFSFGQAGFAFGGPLARDRVFYFFSAEYQRQNANVEKSFAVPTVDERGIYRSGATGCTLTISAAGTCTFTGAGLTPLFPTRTQGDAIFSLFPFPNNPGGVYGANTYTQTIRADAEGGIASGKIDSNFKIKERQQSFTARYNYTQSTQDVPSVDGALFSSVRPFVRTLNISTFLNSELSGPSASTPIFNQLRLSYGRTRLNFNEMRDPNTLPSSIFGNVPFLLNRRYIENVTLPTCTGAGCTSPANVLYQTSAAFPTTEHRLGPIGQVRIAGFSPVGVDVFNFPQRRVNNTYQIADNVSMRVGSHSFVFGADIRKTELNSELPRNSRPLITFNGVVRFSALPQLSPVDLAAAGAPSGFFTTLARGDSSIGLRYYQLNFFAQDEWQLDPNLSISFGLRYEYNTVPSEKDNKIERTFNAPELNLVPDLRTFIGNRTRLFEPDRNNFAPRIGIAFSHNFFGNKTTTIRGGTGVYYDQILGSVVSQSRNVFPTFLTLNSASLPLSCLPNNTCPALFPSVVRDLAMINPLTIRVLGNLLVAPGTLNTVNANQNFNNLVTLFRDFPIVNGIGPTGPGGFGFTLPAQDLETALSLQYHVTFEQELPGNMVMSAGYIGTEGQDLLRFTTPNVGPNVLLDPQILTTGAGNCPFTVPAGGNEPVICGSVLTPPFGNVTRPRRTAGSVNFFVSTGISEYHALQLGLSGTFRNQFRHQFNYTLSKAEDDVSDVFDLAGAFALPQSSQTFAGEDGPSGFDARHRFSYSFVYDLPEFKDRSNAYRQLLGGWQIASTGRFRTGQPFTVNTIFDINLDGNLTDRLNNTNGITITGNRQQPLQLTTSNTFSLLGALGRDGSIGRNTFRAGNLLTFDVSVGKSFHIAENTSIKLRMDIFNLTDRANFGIPVRILEAAGFGRATDTVTPGRRVQFALKFVF
jgi:hypothetical protein